MSTARLKYGWVGLAASWLLSAASFAASGCGGDAAPGGAADADAEEAEAAGGGSETGALETEAAAPADGERDAAARDAGLGRELQPVRIIRGSADQRVWWDVTIRGSDLTRFDGRVVTVRMGDPTRPPERLASGQAVIEHGEFELVFPQSWEAANYKTKRIFIDADDDQVCQPVADRLFDDFRASPDFVLTVHPGASSEPTDVRPSNGPDEACAFFDAPWPIE